MKKKSIEEQKKEEPKKLKPVMFVKGEYDYFRQDKFRQNLLLKALQITADPEKLRKMARLKTVAEVYRTLDKIAIRREYHEALARHGIDLDEIVTGIKKICKTAFKDETKLKGYQTLLKSLGLSDYKDVPAETEKNWEDILKDVAEKQFAGGEKIKLPEYDVDIPEVPEEEKKKREEEREEGKSIYE